MQYFIAFLEGFITFISPCLLPMLPVYVSYFAGGSSHNIKKTLKNALGFVVGFTVIFVILGALAGTLGGLLKRYQLAVNIITGLVVVCFGLNFTGVIKLNIFKGISSKQDVSSLGFFSSILFGIVFSIGWTPYVGAFLGSALMMASQYGQLAGGVMMLVCYSIGLAIPFVVSALLIDKLKSAFNFIKQNYKIINMVCGILLMLVGLMMMTGLWSRLLSVLS